MSSIHNMFIKILITSFFVSTISTLTFGQSAYFRVRTLRHTNEFSFPIFQGGRTSQAVSKINKFLQLSELMVLADRRSRNVFEQVMKNDGTIYGGKVWMKARVYSNNPRILSVGFDESSCGMTCAYWHRYYTFNPINGDRIDLRDIFTDKGYGEFTKRVIKKRTDTFRSEVRLKVKKEFQEEYGDAIGCIERDDLSDFFIQKRSIVIDGENCLNKGQKFAGFDMYGIFRLPEFQSYLNNYGRIAFSLSGGRTDEFHSIRLPQLFEGSVNGSIPIVMVLNTDFENGIMGVYAYVKYGKGIALTGNLTDAGLSLTEYVISDEPYEKPWGETYKYEENGFISGSLTHGQLTGTWTNKERTRSFPINASIQ